MSKGSDFMGKVFVDTHTHYAHRRFDSGRDEILCGLADNDVIAVIEGGN